MASPAVGLGHRTLDQHFQNALLDFFAVTDTGLLEAAMNPALVPATPAATAGIPVDLIRALDEIEAYVSMASWRTLAACWPRLAAASPPSRRWRSFSPSLGSPSHAESWFFRSEVHALSRLSGLIALVARRIRRGASGLTAQQRGEVLSALEAATDGLNHGRVAEFDACIRRLKLALRLLEPD